MQAFSPHAAGMPSFMEMVSTYANAANSRMGMRRLNLAAQSQAFEQQQAEENQTFDQGLRAAKEQRDQALFAELQQQRAVSAVRAAKEFEWASAENLMKLEDQQLKLDALKRQAVADAAYSDARMNGEKSALGAMIVKSRRGKQLFAQGVPHTAGPLEAADDPHTQGPLEEVPGPHTQDPLEEASRQNKTIGRDFDDWQRRGASGRW